MPAIRITGIIRVVLLVGTAGWQFSCRSVESAPPLSIVQASPSPEPISSHPPPISDSTDKDIPSVELHFYLASESPDDEFNTPILFRRHELHMNPTPILTRNDILHAEFKEIPGRTPAVAVTFTDDAGKRVAEITRSSLGRFLVIMVDGTVVSIPRIASAIENRAHITGRFTAEQARLWAESINRAAQP